MANPPWARLTKPIRPMVTDSPTDTMNSTMPAAAPPRRMPIKSMGRKRPRPAARRRQFGHSRYEARLLAAPADLELLAHVLHRGDEAEALLVQPAVLLHQLAQILVHDDVARRRIDHDRAARAVGVLPAPE